MDRLFNTVRPYAWGSTTAIPELLGTPPTGEPQAELWMGAHPAAPSLVDRGAGRVPLGDVLAADPRRELGDAVVDRFGAHLPFLMKVLAADAPLSLQVHPDQARARAGYADEEARGIPVDALHRNYRDPNHKPEMICALTPFRGLCGFRAAPRTAALLDGLGVDSLKPYVDLLRASPESAALREVLTAVLTADPAPMTETVRAAAAAVARRAGEPGAFAADYAAYAEIADAYPDDPGLIAAMLLNVVTLQPGEALYLGAGVPHAYLRGTGVEIMASSDNVLRCGLTSKHMDVPELLRVVEFRSADPGVLRPQRAEGGEERYPAPVEEFRLSRYVVGEDAVRLLDGRGPQVLLCTAGTVRVRDESGSGDTGSAAGDADAVPLARGESVFVPAGAALVVSGPGALFRATVAG